jgi:hypothetical protein
MARTVLPYFLNMATEVLVSIADVNNDSWPDLIVANLNINNVGILLGDGHGYFGSQATYSSGTDS